MRRTVRCQDKPTHGAREGGRSRDSPAVLLLRCLQRGVPTQGKILAADLRNKLFAFCLWHKSCSKDPPPPLTTANISQDAPIGNEEAGGINIAEDLLSGETKTSLSHLTTDGDDKTAGGVMKVMADKAGLRTKPLMDRVNLNKSIRGMPAKNKVKYRFAVEVARRLDAQGPRTRRRVEMERAIERAMEAFPSCYGGPTVRALQLMMKRQRYKRAYYKEEGTKTRARMNVVKNLNAYDETRENRARTNLRRRVQGKEDEDQRGGEFHRPHRSHVQPTRRN
uniref:Mutator-like transposase domain-containing protein n=1 Tax=Branchiostoma floridae TaxID=7739 RepID=C3XUU3_BRAFL|eukprot:XP_002612159.1 hypothetical protein BRAFLDRAFT_88898 [Branchiostoma floridae]